MTTQYIRYTSNSGGSSPTGAAGGDLTGTYPNPTIAAGAVDNSKISTSAAIDFSKLAALTSANILVGNGSNVAASVAMSGDITISNAGVTAIGSGKVTNAMLAGSIAFSKLVALTANKALQTSGGGVIVEGASTAAEQDFLSGVTSAIQTQLNGKQAGPLTGDVTTSGAAATLATVNSNVGSFTLASITVDAKGRITAASNGSAGSGTVTSVALSVPASSLFSVAGSPVTTSGTLAITTAGTSGGIPYFDSTSTMNSSGALTASRLILGGGAGAAPTVLGSLGTTTTVLHGNAAGAPTFGAVSLTADVSGTLAFGNGGTGATSLAAGVVKSDGSVLSTEATLAVARGGTNLASGTSGGILGYTASGTLASSAALTASAIVLGGGAGATPTALGSLGTTTTVLHGNAGGAPTFGAVSLTADVSGTLPIANGGTNSTATPTAGGVAYGTGTANAYTSAGTSQNWVLSGGAGAPTMSNTTTTGKTIDGSADETQFLVEANSTQTNPVLYVRKSDGTTSLLQVTLSNGTGIRGTTTNDNAATGEVGEVLTATLVRSSGSSLSSGTTSNVTSLSVTAGNWLITGAVGLTPATTTSVTDRNAAIATTSATLPGADVIAVPTSNEMRVEQATAANVPGNGSDWVLNIPTYSAKFSTTTTVYLVTNCSFSVSTLKGYGYIQAVRIR